MHNKNTAMQPSHMVEVLRELKTNLAANFSHYEEAPFDRGKWKQLGELGVHGWPIPEKYGGSGWDASHICRGLEVLGEYCEDGGLAFAVAAQMLSCTIPIVKYGSSEQKEKLLPGICSGDIIIANSITEPESGSDVYDMDSRAILDEKGNYHLNGEKIMITSGPIADYHLVYMATDHEKGYFGGITAFLVDNSLDGVNAEVTLSKMGLDTAQMGQQFFNNVCVSEDYILGEVGGGGPIFNKSMEWERGLLGAIHIGTMGRILNQIIKYTKARKVGGQSISKYQSIAHKLSDMKVRYETGKLLLYAASESMDTSDAGMMSSIAKLQVSESLQASCLDALQIMGGRGYLKDSPFERYVRDALSATIYSGTSEVQRSIIARYLGL